MAEKCVDLIYHMGLAESYCQRVREEGDLNYLDKALRELRRAYELAPDNKRVCFLVTYYAGELSLAYNYPNRLFHTFLAQLRPYSQMLQEVMGEYGLQEEIEETARNLNITLWEATKIILEDPEE